MRLIVYPLMLICYYVDRFQVGSTSYALLQIKISFKNVLRLLRLALLTYFLSAYLSYSAVVPWLINGCVVACNLVL